MNEVILSRILAPLIENASGGIFTNQPYETRLVAARELAIVLLRVLEAIKEPKA